MNPKIEVNIGKLTLKNPVIAASGTFGYGREYGNFFDIKRLGAITTKTVTLKPRPGNKPPRIAETPSGMLNSIGLQNEGIEDFIKNKIPQLKKTGAKIIVSIGAESSADFAVMAKMLSGRTGISALEINVSCPNVEHGVKNCRLFSQDEFMVNKIVKSVRKATKLPLIAKLSPNVTDITLFAKAAQDAGADAVSLVNTFFAMSIDIRTKKSALGNISGGLSGPCIRPIACFMVRETFKKIKIPIIGMGGIMNSDDAIQFLIAGASAVSVGTGNFVDPACSIKIIEGIKKYMIEFNIKDIKKLIGSLEA